MLNCAIFSFCWEILVRYLSRADQKVKTLMASSIRFSTETDASTTTNTDENYLPYMEYSQIWDLMSVQNFGGQKIFHTARLLKNMDLDFRKISGNLGILHLQQLIFLKSTTKTIYICTYTINLWSQNNFLINVAISLCKMVGVTFEPRDLSGNCMSPTLP
jgi:hypothetical protein